MEKVQIFQVVSIISFVLCGILFLVSLFLFFWLDILEVINEITGRKAKRQIQNYRMKDTGKKVPRETQKKVVAQQKNQGPVRGEPTESLDNSTEVLLSETDVTELLIQDTDATELLDDITELLDNSGDSSQVDSKKFQMRRSIVVDSKGENDRY